MFLMMIIFIILKKALLAKQHIIKNVYEKNT